MATKTFSSRTDEADLAYADAVTREQFGLSFGQYCGSVLIAAIKQGADLPTPASSEIQLKTAAAVDRLKAVATSRHNASVGRMTDAEIKDLIASRYE